MTDMGVPPLTNSTNVLINISPVNEFSPQITHDLSATVTVKENQETGNGLVLIDVNATDKDFGQQGKQGVENIVCRMCTNKYPMCCLGCRRGNPVQVRASGAVTKPR